MLNEKLNVLYTNEQLDQLIKYLKNPEVTFVAYDCETTGLSGDATVIGFSVCADIEEAFYVVLDEWKPEFKDVQCPQCEGHGDCGACNSHGVVLAPAGGEL